MSARRLALAAGVLALAALADLARAQPAGSDPAASCASAGTDDALRPMPQGLADAVRSRFGLHDAPLSLVARGTVWRCFGGRALVCATGANLPCGKLNGRTNLPIADAWCGKHADAPVPAVVTGHDSLWRWRCHGVRAVPDGQAWHRDGRGFARENWKPLDDAG